VRRATLLLVVGAAIVALALTASPPQHPRTIAQVTHDVLPVFVAAGNGATSYQFTWTGAGRAERLVVTLAVFAEPGGPQDVLPPAFQQFARFMSRQPGLELDDLRARLLVTSGAHRLYGVPMKTGTVCMFRDTPGGSSCPTALLHGAYPQVEAGWKSRRGQVWGLTDNGAASVRVQLRSGWLAAKLGRNGFYLELPPRIVAPKQIVVSERSGLRHVYDIKRCRVDIAQPLLTSPVGPPPC
jgi:hypothetical protein